MEIRAAAGKRAAGGGGGAVSWLNKTDWRGLSLTGKTGRGEGVKKFAIHRRFFLEYPFYTLTLHYDLVTQEYQFFMLFLIFVLH